MQQIPWYAARASGVVAWALVLLTIVWGLLFATRVLGRRATPAWLLSLHRFLAALSLVFVGVHVGAIMLDSYTSFGPSDVLVPLAASWHPVAVAWGIVGMYLLVAIEVTSLLRHRLSHKVWRAIHVCSYLLFGTVTIHFVTAGTDVRTMVASTAGVLVATAAAFGSAALYLWRSDPGTPVDDIAPADRPSRSTRRPVVRAPGRRADNRVDDRAPGEHPHTEEEGGDDGEGRHELVPLQGDAQRHSPGHGHDPGTHDPSPGVRVPVEARQGPARDQTHGKGPADPEEPDEAGVLVMGAPTDEHEHHHDGEIGEEGGQHPHGSRAGGRTCAHSCSVAAPGHVIGIGH